MSERLRREEDEEEAEKVEKVEESAIFACIVADDLPGCVLLLAADKDLITETTRQGMTPLHLAAKLDKLDIVKYLVHTANASVHSLDAKSNTPLHVACMFGRGEVASFLITCKSDVNAVNKDQSTALHMACKSGLLEVCRILVMEKAATDCVDSRQFTPLHVAALAGHLAVAEFLANNCKADVNALTDRGKTAAMLTRNVQLKDMLEKISGVVYVAPEAKAKSTVCFAFEKGECKFGDKCRFSHTGEVVPAVAAPRVAAPARPKKAKGPGMCFAFEKGECDRGDSCKFSHTEALEGAAPVVGEEQHEGRKPRQRKARTGRLPVRSNVCFAFLKGGCTNNDCKFQHLAEEEVLIASKICFAFRDDECKWGDECKFSHDAK